MNLESLKLSIFILTTMLFIYLSRKSLFIIGSHGFYRFFAAESIAALFISNITNLLVYPLVPLQTISCMVLIGAVIIQAAGFLRLRQASKPGERRIDDSLLEFEKTSSLVTGGIYHYIRHPMYASLVFAAWGLFFAGMTASTLCFVWAATFFLISTAKADETECIRYFGDSYRQYMLKTKRFIPFVY